MGLLIPNVTSGVLGMVLGSLAGLLIVLQAWRNSPWDIHDENSYREPARVTLAVATPSIVMFLALATLLLGIGALDRNVAPHFAIAGDLLGFVALGFALTHLRRGWQ